MPASTFADGLLPQYLTIGRRRYVVVVSGGQRNPYGARSHPLIPRLTRRDAQSGGRQGRWCPIPRPRWTPAASATFPTEDRKDTDLRP